MRKILKRVLICFLAAATIWLAGVVRDRQSLREGIIRLHVVAASDSGKDQALKLRVRDAVLDAVESVMADMADRNAAMEYLQENLTMLQDVANRVLAEAGSGDTAVVTLAREAYDTRYYDTFSLPAGIYHSLRITIGDGDGHNWWCVVFPSLCLPGTSEGFEEMAEKSGMEDALACALAGEDGYEVRFFLLEALGKLEILLKRG